MESQEYTEANRRAWNQVTPYHQDAKQDKFFKAFKKPGFSTLDNVITPRLRAIGLEGKRVAQLCCNDGRETLSLRNLGAANAVGFDISDAAIAEAQKLSKTSGIECEFVRINIYDIPESFNANFDLIYISIGVFGWMPDINRFFEVAARLLKPGGQILIYEQHPFCEIFDMDNRDNPLKIANSYFIDKPIADESGMDYWGRKDYRSETSYWFAHTLAAVMTALLRQELTIVAFDEYAHDISSQWEQIEKTGKRLPLSYILQGRKS